MSVELLPDGAVCRHEMLRRLATRRLGELTWRVAIERLVPHEVTPEARLVCAVIAAVIADEEQERDVPLQVLPRWLWSRTCRGYCDALGIGHEALVRAVERASLAYAEAHGRPVEVSHAG